MSSELEIDLECVLCMQPSKSIVSECMGLWLSECKYQGKHRARLKFHTKCSQRGAWKGCHLCHSKKGRAIWSMEGAWFVRACVHMHVCMCARVCMHACMYVCMYVCARVCAEEERKIPAASSFFQSLCKCTCPRHTHTIVCILFFPKLQVVCVCVCVCVSLVYEFGNCKMRSMGSIYLMLLNADRPMQNGNELSLKFWWAKTNSKPEWVRCLSHSCETCHIPMWHVTFSHVTCHIPAWHVTFLRDMGERVWFLQIARLGMQTHALRYTIPCMYSWSFDCTHDALVIRIPFSYTIHGSSYLQYESRHLHSLIKHCYVIRIWHAYTNANTHTRNSSQGEELCAVWTRQLSWLRPSTNCGMSNVAVYVAACCRSGSWNIQSSTRIWATAENTTK